MHRRSCRHCGPAGNGADPEREDSGIRRLHGDIVDVDAEDICADLRKHRRVPLPLTGSSRLDDDLAGRLDAHGGALEGRKAGVLDVTRNAAADVAPLLRSFRFSHSKLRIGAIENAFETAVIVAAVIGDRRSVARLHAGLIRKLLLADEAAPADILAAQRKLARDPVGQPLQHEASGRTSCAAHRRIGNEIGEHDVELDIEGLQGIGPRKGCERRHSRDQAIGHIGAVVVNAVAAHRQQPPLLIGRNLDIPQLIALLRSRQEMLGPVLDPFDRTPKRLRRERDRNLFRIHRAFRSETAAHIRRDDADGTLVAAQMRSHETADHVRRLRRGPDRQASVTASMAAITARPSME